MPTVGPWIQEDDFTEYTTRTEFNTHIDGDLITIGRGEFEQIVPAPGAFFPIAGGEIGGAQGDAVDGNLSGTFGGLALSTSWGYKYGTGGSIAGDRISSVDAQHQYRVRTARSVYAFWEPTETPPPGAVGYEWQGESSPGFPDFAPAVLVGAAIDGSDSQVRGNNADESSIPTLGHAVIPTATTTLRAVDASYDGSDLVTSFSTGGVTVATFVVPNAGLEAVGAVNKDFVDFGEGGLIDVTSYVDTENRLCLITVTPAAAAYDLSDTGIDNTFRQLAAGYALVRLRMQWTYRPPIYRWIYASSPVLRQGQRHDGNGFTSAALVYPHPPNRIGQREN